MSSAQPLCCNLCRLPAAAQLIFTQSLMYRSTSLKLWNGVGKGELDGFPFLDSQRLLYSLKTISEAAMNALKGLIFANTFAAHKLVFWILKYWGKFWKSYRDNAVCNQSQEKHNLRKNQRSNSSLLHPSHPHPYDMSVLTLLHLQLSSSGLVSVTTTYNKGVTKYSSGWWGTPFKTFLQL